MTPVVIVSLVELLLAAVILFLGIQALRRNIRNQINLVFFIITAFMFLWLGLDGFNRLLVQLELYITDIFHRLSECFLLLAALFLINFANIFPGRGAAGARGEKSDERRRNRLNPLLFVLTGVVMLLSFLIFTPLFVAEGKYNPVRGTYLGEFGPAYHANRIFLIICLLVAVAEQRRFIKFHERDPRRIHSRYLIYTIILSVVAGALLYGLSLFTPLDNLYHTGLAFIAFLLSYVIYKILSYQSIGLGGNLYRNLLFFVIWAALLLPVVFLINYLAGALAEGSPLLLALSLSLLFIILIQIYNRLQPRIYSLLFAGQARMDEALASYNTSIMSLSSGEKSEARSRLVEFLDDFYQPRFLVFYTAEGGDGSRLTQDRTLTKIADVESIPPADLPQELQEFLNQSPQAGDGGLIVDTQAAADLGDKHEASRALSQFASFGAEIMIPYFYEEDQSPSESPASETDEEEPSAAATPWPRKRGLHAVLILGMARGGRPLDHSDWSMMLALRGPTLLAMKNQELLQSTTRLQQQLMEENKRITNRLSRDLPGRTQSGQAATFVYTEDGTMSRVMQQVEKFADRDSPVLIAGETGTGKEQVARILHAQSQRPGQLITVNCSAIPQDLIENELFGHVKGAFTGATDDSEGLVARASGGTRFLDEIGELPLAGQVKLLRLVQERQYEKIGGGETLTTDARFIFATNRDLEQEVDKGGFRSDLYYRISTFEIRLPPLRERREDLPLLIKHFLLMARDTFERASLKMTPEAEDLLVRHSWPGNVRELENLIMRTVVLSDSDILDVNNLPVMFKDEMNFDRKQKQLESIIQEQARLEKELLLEALEQSGGNQRRAAEILKISRGSLQYRMKQYGLAGQA